MNKKILSIFALIMAISILGVSCADNNTTKPEDQKPATLTADEQKEILKAIGTLSIPKAAGGGNFDFVFDENKKVTASGSTYTVEEVAVSADPGSGAKANYVDIIPVIQAKDFSVKGVTINKNAATYQKDISDAKKVKVIIPFTKGETTGTIVLQLSGDHTSNNLTFGAKEVTATDVEAALQTLGTLAFNAQQSNNEVDFGEGTIATTTFTVSHNNTSGADGSKATITASLEAKLSDLATALKAKGIVLKTATVTTFAGSGANASTTISIEADTDYVLATAINSGTITITITLTTTNANWGN